MTATVKAFRAFRAEMMSGGERADDFADFDSRRLRYALQWAFYENTAYDEIHDWATTYKTRYGLYKYVRDIYSPARRLADFARDHIWGGQLDSLAGVGGCLPIVTDNERLRPAIAQVWAWSNLATVKDIITLQGAVMGDTILRVVDAVGKVYLEQVHPGTISELDKDRFGNVKGYVIEEIRPHPETGKTVEYRETCGRGEGEEVIFRTYIGNSLFPWNGMAAEWMEPYGFVPMVHIQHNNVGEGWGQSEFHGAFSKINEVSDLGSLLGDQIRKSVNPKWLFSGVKAGSTAGSQPTSTIRTSSHPQPGREESDALYASDPQAKATALVADLNIEGVLANINKIIEAIEAEYPELKFQQMRSRGEISGEALRIARQPIETKINRLRGSYDNALVRAQQMAVAIGGWRSLPGFEGFGLDSYAKGQLNHSIGARSVFAVDPIDRLEESKVFWEAAGLASQAGASLDSFLRDSGWDKERIAAFFNSGSDGESDGVADGAPSNLESVQGLNGAQITAALEILAKTTGGTVTPQAATELLVALGIDRERANLIVSSTNKIDKPEGDSLFWAGAKEATEAGYPLELYLMDANWDKERIRRYVELVAEQSSWVGKETDITQ